MEPVVLDPEHVGAAEGRAPAANDRPPARPGMHDPGTVVVGCHWHDRSGELSYVARAVAGAASRCGPVAVLVPGTVGTRQPDGAFDLEAIGEGDRLHWPVHLGPGQLVVVDELSVPVATMLAAVEPRAVFTLSGESEEGLPEAKKLRLVPDADAAGEPSVEVHVAVNRLAQRHRHHGFGFTGYQLVLSDRSGRHDDPPPAAAWISGAFHDDDVVVVEDAVAWAWRGRVLRGMVPVDTRMDLWRLVAHANACVDLAPGRQIARECVEALRFGTPIVVPATAGPAVAHAAAGGETFGDAGELVSAVARLRDPANRSTASDAGRRYADAYYGDPARPVADLRQLLATA